MQQTTLAQIVVQFLEFLELADDDHLDLHLAVKQEESISAQLTAATGEERRAVMDAARERLAWLLREPDEYGYSPRKAVTPQHRLLLEKISSGEVFGWQSGQ